METKIGILGKSFKQIKDDWNEAKSGISSLGYATTGKADKYRETQQYQSFFNKSTLTDTDIQIAKEWNQVIKSGNTDTARQNEILQESSEGFKKLAQSANGGKISVGALSEAQSNLEKTSIAASIASTALNAALSFGIGLAIQGVVALIDNLVNYQQNCIDNAAEIKASYTEVKNSVTSNTDTIRSMEEDFNELSKGVDTYGNNISLTADQYKRYQEIVSTILDISPQLTTGYDNEGKAIANKNDLIEKSIELEKHRLALARQDYVDKAEDVYNGAKAEYDRAVQGFDREDSGLKYSLFDQLTNESGSKPEKLTNILQSVLKVSDEELGKYNNTQAFVSDNYERIIENIEQILALSQEQGIISANERAAIKDSINSWNEKKLAVDAANKSMGTYISEYASTLDGYEDLSDRKKDILTNFINSAYTMDRGKDNIFDGRIPTVVNQLKEMNDTGEAAFVTLSEGMQSGNISVADYNKNIDILIGELSKVTGLSRDDVITQFGFDDDGLFSDIGALEERIKEYPDTISESLSKTSITTAQSFDKLIENLFDGNIDDNVEAINLLWNSVGNFNDIESSNFNEFVALVDHLGLSSENISSIMASLDNLGWNNAESTLSSLSEFSDLVSILGLEDKDKLNSLWNQFDAADVAPKQSVLAHQLKIGKISTDEYNTALYDLYSVLDLLPEQFEKVMAIESKGLDAGELENEIQKADEYLSALSQSSDVNQEMLQEGAKDYIRSLEAMKTKAMEAGDAQAFEQITSKIEELQRAAENAGDSLSKINSDISSLSSAFSEYNGSGELSAETVKNLLDSHKDFAKYIIRDGDKFKLSQQALDDLTAAEQRQIEETNKYVQSLKDKQFGTREFAEEYNSFLDVLNQSYDDAWLGNFSEKMKSINNDFIDGKTDAIQYFNAVQEQIRSINFSSLASNPAQQGMFAGLAQSTAGGMEYLFKQFNSGEIDIGVFSDSISEANENLIDLYANLHDLHQDENGQWLNASDEVDSYVAEIQGTQDSLSRLDALDPFIDAIQESYGYLNELSDFTGDFTNIDWSNVEIGSSAYQELADNVSDALWGLRGTNSEVFNQITSDIAEQTGLQLGQLTQSQDQLYQTLSSNAGALDAAIISGNNAVGASINDVVNAGGKVLSALGTAIKGFDYTLKFQSEYGGFNTYPFGINGNGLVGKMLGDMSVTVPNIKYKITGEGGDSIQALGGSLEEFGAIVSSYSAQTNLSNYLSGGTGNTSPALRRSSGGSSGGGGGNRSSSREDPAFIAQKELIETIKEQTEVLKEQSKILESAQKGVLRVLDDEITGLKEKKKLIEDEYDTKIKNIDNEIDKLKEINEEEDLNLKLKEAQDRLENARKNRTIRIYSKDTGWYWSVDEKAIEGAEKNVKDAENDQKIHNLENQKNALEAEKDEQINIIDEQIYKLDELKDKWSDSLDIFDDMQNYRTMLEEIGDFENMSYEQRLSALDSFIQCYNDLQQQILNKQDELTDAEDNLKIMQGESPKVYSRGTINALEGFAITQDYGNEILIRNSGNGRYTYLEDGDGVLPADVTRNLWSLGKYNIASLAERLEHIIYPKIHASVSMNPQQPLVAENHYHFGNIALPNVQNATDFVRELTILQRNHKTN